MRNLTFDASGFVTAIAQDAQSREILMVAMMNAEAYELTLETRLVHFWSRSRRQLWLKGKTSGNLLNVREIRLDCDGDAVLLMVEPSGPACHTGARSCFFNNVEM